MNTYYQDIQLITRLIGFRLYQKPNPFKAQVIITTNPGPNGHQWVKAFFADKTDEEA